jgi:uncharacterized protein with ParB-like and HNH nuclease domain
MKELVFNIRNIFNLDINEGCLGQYDAEKYHIPAYQRGYKWASLKPTDAIPVLMNDLWEAYENSKTSNRKEYYMQYITVKRISETKYLEVIDGQQRLTSFSILLSVFSLLLDKDINPSKGKLEYAIREDFFNNYIYEKDKLNEFLSADWDNNKGIVIQNQTINKQDIFYLHSAAKHIYNYLNQESIQNELIKFNEFILEYVKIIVNEIEPHIDSERVFRNLNSNKVGLTESELIKGLLLTKAARKTSMHTKGKHFREILEIRTALGRQWDEITTWVNDKKVKHFYFTVNNKQINETSFNTLLKKELEKPDSVTHERAILLLLISMTFNKDVDVKDNQYQLFNYFHKQIKTKISSWELLIKLKEIYAILKDRYENDGENAVYNLMGYAFFVEGNNLKKLEYLSNTIYWTKDKLIQDLIAKRNELLPDNLTQLRYGSEYNTAIHRVLLALSVFETSKERKEPRFDFFNFSQNKWSLEHIFPQSPEGKWRGKNHVLTNEEKVEILKMIGEDYEEIEQVKNVLSIEDRERTDEEKEVYYRALQKTWVNNLGNMSLLSVPDNSSNGCAMFKLKRENINEMIKNGKFVPKHTFEIFNKVQLESDSLLNWTNNDSNRHFTFIEQSIKKLKENIRQ